MECPEPDLQIEFVKVPEGTFIMGGEGGDDDELPAHEVYLDTFWIGKYEVTAAQYTAFLNDVGTDRDEAHIWIDTSYEGAMIQRQNGGFAHLPGLERFPAAGVTWYGARAFAGWLSSKTGLPFDLPTEAQWEKAARGKHDKRRIFPWGVRLNPDLARYKHSQPTKVGSYPEGVSPFGAFDMAGNVSEWVNDWYQRDYYEHGPTRNPTGPETGERKILRGGDWSSRLIGVNFLRSANRMMMHPQVGELTMGFRLTLNMDDPAEFM